MKPKRSRPSNSTPGGAAALRARAEQKLREKTSRAGPPRSAQQTQELVHELQVHQIELQLQNEELVRASAELEASLTRYADLYDSAPVGYLTLTPTAMIGAANLTVARLLGLERERLVGLSLAALVIPESKRAFLLLLDQVFRQAAKVADEFGVQPRMGPPIWARIEAVRSADGQACHAAVLDLTERHQAQLERDRSIAELKQALAQVKQLRGLLPICCACKKIRDDRGYWRAVEEYLMTHAEVTFTHGLCPTCAQAVHAQLDASTPDGGSNREPGAPPKRPSA